MAQNTSVDGAFDRELRQACAQLCRRWQAGESCRVEEYLDTLGIAGPGDQCEAGLELIYAEFLAREARGEQLDFLEWYARFPHWRDNLRRLFEVHKATRRMTEFATSDFDSHTRTEAGLVPPFDPYVAPEVIVSRSLVVYADRAPPVGTRNARERYRRPRLASEMRQLGPLSADSIRVRILRVGICGTDLHLLETSPDGYIMCSSPMHIASHGRIIGHEAVAVVTDAGTDDLPFSRGDVVCFESIVTCKRCRMCRQGNFNQCEKSRLVGLELDGLFTEFADVPASLAHCVNDLAGSDRDLEALACVEPAAVSYLACHNARINPGDSVVVLGAGPIGYYAALIAKTLFGAASVCVSEVSEFRREFVQRVSDQAVPPEVLHESDDQVDVLIDAAGAMSDVNRLIPRMYGNGRIVLLARTGQSLHIEHVDHVISKALRIIGSRGQLGGAFGTVLNLMRNGRIDPHLAVTRVVNGFDELATALQDPGRIVASDCKVVANLAE